MARTYSKLLTSIWQDAHFMSLTIAAQRLYFLLLASPKLSSAGCVTVSNRRLARLSNDTDSIDIESSLDELTAAKYIARDLDSEELLIRTFIRHDGAYKHTKMRKGVVAAIAHIESIELRSIANRMLTDCLSALAEGGDVPPPEDDPSGIDWESDADGLAIDTESDGQDSQSDPDRSKPDNNSHLTPTPDTIHLPPDTTQEAVESESPLRPLQLVPAIEEEDKLTQIINEYARLAVQQCRDAGKAIHHMDGFVDDQRKRAVSKPELERWIRDYPTAPANAIACWLHGDKHSMRNFAS